MKAAHPRHYARRPFEMDRHHRPVAAHSDEGGTGLVRGRPTVRAPGPFGVDHHVPPFAQHGRWQSDGFSLVRVLSIGTAAMNKDHVTAFHRLSKK